MMKPVTQQTTIEMDWRLKSMCTTAANIFTTGYMASFNFVIIEFQLYKAIRNGTFFGNYVSNINYPWKL